jgi:hypothetical protein
VDRRSAATARSANGRSTRVENACRAAACGSLGEGEPADGTSNARVTAGPLVTLDRHVRALLLPACLVALALPPAGAQEPQRYEDAVVAIVEGEPILLHELELACRFRPEYHALGDGDALARLEFRRQVLVDGIRTGNPDDDELAVITQRALLQKAKTSNITITVDDEERINQLIGRIAERTRGGMTGLRAALTELGVPWERFVERQRTNMLIQKLLLTTVSRDIFINPAEIRRHYDERQADYERAGEVRLRQIVLYGDPDDASRFPIPREIDELVKAGRWDARAFAEEKRAEILSGARAFEDASHDLTMEVRSDRELTLPIDRVYEAFHPGSPVVPAIAQLRIGEVSQVIEERQGTIQRLYLLLVVDRQERGHVPFEHVQDAIEMRLKEEVWSQRRDAFIERTRSEAHIEVYLQLGPRPEGPR